MEEKKIKNCSHCKYYKWDIQFDEDICTKQNTELKISSSDDYCCENWIFHDPEYYYKQLQLKDKMIEKLLDDIADCDCCPLRGKCNHTDTCADEIEQYYKQQALAELEE